MPDHPPHLMMTVVIDRGEEDPIAAAAEALGIEPTDIDNDYGCLLIDPDRDLHVVMVAPDAVPESTNTTAKDYRGPFANPRIETFGPPKFAAEAARAPLSDDRSAD